MDKRASTAINEKPENIYILNKAQEDLTSEHSLDEILRQVVENPLYGDIHWPNKMTNSQNNAAFNDKLNKIEEQLKENNMTFSRHPNDLTHALLSKHATVNKNLKKGDDVTVNLADYDDILKEWQVKRIYEASTGVIGKGRTFDGPTNKVQICLGVLYLNKKRKQLVLAFKSIVADWKSFISSNGQLANSLEGIVQNKIVPQLYACYEMTRKANQKANELKCFLSFTGFASGAWLAEHSVFYSYQDFENKQTKGVLFESPGMVKTREEFLKCGIINDEKDFRLEDLHIVNYLTAPCFSNSCNQHVGKVFRLFVDSEKYKSINKLDEFLASVEKTKGLGKLYSLIKSKNAQFFLNGLVTMFSNGNLDLIIEQFEIASGKPKMCERVLSWPTINVNIDGNKLKENLKELSESSAEKLIELAPIFDFIKKPAAKIIGSIVGNVADLAAKKLLPGVHLLINIMIEMSNGNINLEHFENPSFYSTLDVSEKINENVNKISEIPSNSQFSVTFYNRYKTSRVDSLQLILKERDENVHACLVLLENIKDLERVVQKKTSKIVFENLQQLQSMYRIESKDVGKDYKTEKTIKSTSPPHSIEQIEEILIRLLLLDGKLKNYLIDGKTIVEQKLCHLHNSINLKQKKGRFVKRQDLIQSICKRMDQEQIIVLSAIGGSGKTYLVVDIGRHLINKGSHFKVYSLLCDFNFETEFYTFAKSLLEIRDLSGMTAEDVINKAQVELNYFHSTQFILILDNVEKLENLLEKVVDKLSLATNVKFLITTRNSNLIEGLNSIKIDMFNENEAKEFIEQNLKKKVLTLEQWKKLNGLITFENEVLPLKLDLTISYINKELSKFNQFDEILDEVKQRSTQSDKLVEVEDYLFEDLFKDDKYKNFLVYCSYFKPDCISLKFLNKLFDSSQNIEIFEKLSEQSFIAVNYDDSTFSMHRLIQAKIKNYRKAHASNFESEKHILDRIIQVLAANVDEPNNLTRLDDLVKNRERDVQFTQIEEVLNFSFENVELNQTERVALMNKLAMYYKYCQINYKKECELRTMVLERIKIIHGEENHPQIADSLSNLGASFANLGDNRKALEFKEKAYEMQKVLFGNEAHPDIAYSLFNLGIIYERLDDNPKALQFYDECYQMRLELYGITNVHPDLVESLENFIRFFKRINDSRNASIYQKKLENIKR